MDFDSGPLSSITNPRSQPPLPNIVERGVPLSRGGCVWVGEGLGGLGGALLCMAVMVTAGASVLGEVGAMPL